jgi:hypothetical protein
VANKKSLKVKQCAFSWSSSPIGGKVTHLIVTENGVENLISLIQHRCTKPATQVRSWSVDDRQLSYHTCLAHVPKNKF